MKVHQLADHPIGLDRDLSGASPAQRSVFDAIASGPRGSVPSPFLAMLDAPELTRSIQQVGVTIRFGGSIEASHRELAILATAGAIGCRYEWNYHAPIARSCGTPEAVIQETIANAGTVLDRPWRTIIDVARGVTLNHRLDDDLLDQAVSLFGRAGATELIAIAGYYSLLANFIIIGGHDV